jgi:hypothetical protein
MSTPAHRDGKPSSFLAVLSFVLGASALSSTLFLWFVKARVSAAAQPTLERTALGCGVLGVALVVSGVVLKRRAS